MNRPGRKFSGKSAVLGAVSLVLLVAVMTGVFRPAPLPPITAAGENPPALVVFDIDGTLTGDVLAVASPREHAVEAVDVFARHGFGIVYLSARFPWFSSRLPQWLDRHGFPEGPVFVAQSIGDNQGPLRFKQGMLEQLKRSGWSFAAAFGDSSSDFQAYANVGIPRERVFALKREGKAQCEPGPWVQCLDGWGEHLTLLAKQQQAP